MAEYHGYNATVAIASVDLTDHVRKVDLPEKAGSISTTALGDTYESSIGGLKSFSVNLDFIQDQAAGEVYATLQPLIGTVATFQVKADAGATSTTNRTFSGSVVIGEFSHVNAEPGSLDTFSVSWEGTGSLTVATS